MTQRNLSASSDFLNAAQQMFFNQPNARGLTAANPDPDATTQSTVAIGVVRSALEDFPFAGDIAGGGAPGFASANAAQHSAQAGEGILESQPHDNVHSAMGAGDGAFMISFLSPVDPIFFLHHANLDRLWDVWTRRQTALARPTLPEGADLAAWSNDQFLFFSDENGQPVTKTSAGDYESIGDFGYDYAAGSGEDEVPAPAVAAAAPKAAVAEDGSQRPSSRSACPWRMTEHDLKVQHPWPLKFAAARFDAQEKSLRAAGQERADIANTRGE